MLRLKIRPSMKKVVELVYDGPETGYQWRPAVHETWINLDNIGSVRTCKVIGDKPALSIVYSVGSACCDMTIAGTYEELFDLPTSQPSANVSGRPGDNFLT